MAMNGSSYQKVPAVDPSHYESIPNGTSSTSYDGSGKKKWIAGAAVLAALAVAYGCYVWQPNKAAVIDSIGKSLLPSSSTSSSKTTGKLKLFDDISTCIICGAIAGGRTTDQQQALLSQYVSFDHTQIVLSRKTTTRVRPLHPSFLEWVATLASPCGPFTSTVARESPPLVLNLKIIQSWSLTRPTKRTR
jgi:hypothetical protein